MVNPFAGVTSQLKEKRKLLHTICIDFAIIAVGINATQTGPALLDLQLITNTNTQQASSFLTAASVGSVLGSLAMGWFGRWNKQLTMCVLLLGTAVSITALPWCSNYGLMIFMHGLTAMFRAAFNTVATVETIRTWAPNSRLWLQLFNLFFSIGGIISPLITKPFLAPRVTNSTIPSDNSTDLEVILPLSMINSTGFDTTPSSPATFSDTHADNSTRLAETLALSMTNTGFDTTPSSEAIFADTHVQFAYLIPGVWFAVSCLIFIIEYRWKEKESENAPTSGGYKSLGTPLPLPILTATIILSCLMFFFSVSFQQSIAAYLLTFCVTYLDWSKSDGANLTTIYWVCHASSRFFAIFYTNVVSPLRILIVAGFLALVFLVLMIFSSLYAFNIGVWICTAIMGLCLSAEVPGIYMFIEEKIMRVTPRMVSFFNLSITIPGMVNPQIIGYLMQDVTPMWFLYLLAIHAVAFLLSILIVYLWAKYVVQPRRD